MGDGTACLENGGGSVGEPKVRIHLPPAGSLQTFGPSRVAAIESVAEPETRAADHAVKSRLERPRHDKSKMLRNARRCPPSKRGRAMSTVLPFPAGGYRFIAHQFQYSGGVAAEPGFRFERALHETRAAGRRLRRDRGLPWRHRTLTDRVLRLRAALPGAIHRRRVRRVQSALCRAAGRLRPPRKSIRMRNVGPITGHQFPAPRSPLASLPNDR
jgi:hypothetical protein